MAVKVVEKKASTSYPSAFRLVGNRDFIVVFTSKTEGLCISGSRKGSFGKCWLEHISPEWEPVDISITHD